MTSTETAGKRRTPVVFIRGFRYPNANTANGSTVFPDRGMSPK